MSDQINSTNNMAVIEINGLSELNNQKIIENKHECLTPELQINPNMSSFVITRKSLVKVINCEDYSSFDLYKILFFYHNSKDYTITINSL